MKKILLLLFIALSIMQNANAANLTDLTWANVCDGKMEDAWYATDAAKSIADTVLSVQKTNGGWMKNDQLHKLTASELQSLKHARNEHSCLDNYATTQEMRFLARVYQGTKIEKYRTAFRNALNMIIAAKFAKGGWGQYWPLTDDKWSYQNYITFNDDLTINALKMMRDVYQNKGIYKDMTDEDTREKCIKIFNEGIEMIISCQIDDNGTKAAWCAQHDPNDLLPTEGRPHELPSVSGYESSSILSFLMSVENPSKELQECISSAVKWLDDHKIPGKAVENYTNAKGEADRRIVDRSGSNLWGRFIQIGGASGEKVYNKLFKKLQDRGKSRSYTKDGKTYTYMEYEIAKASYNPEMAYQPIYAIYKNELAHLFYRFLYNYADTDPVTDSKGCPVATSLMATNRTSYQYVGSWCQKVIDTEYPAWKKRIEAINAAGDSKQYILDQSTHKEDKTENGAIVYTFSNGFTISNTGGKSYATGIKGTTTIKYSKDVGYVIHIPSGLAVSKVTIDGYCNYEVNTYLSELGPKTFTSTDYIFPAKDSDGTLKTVSHTIDLSDNPVSSTMKFKLKGQQCALVFNLYCIEVSGLNNIGMCTKGHVSKCIKNGHIVILKDGKCYNLVGQEAE